jgi:16S rRNA (cytosine967-C5)-methyltransferase
LLDVNKGDSVLDLCGAPGGKTGFAAEIAGESGRVYSCELNGRRMKLVAETVGRLGLNNVAMLQCDGKSPPFSNKFKRILLDAPCSGTGVLHRHPEARWIKKLEDLARLTQLQDKLLDASSSLVDVGGVLVYSTCSLEPEENESRIQAFLASHPDFSLQAPPDAVPQNIIDKNGFLRITPFDHKLDGMFGARLKKMR